MIASLCYVFPVALRSTIARPLRSHDRLPASPDPRWSATATLKAGLPAAPAAPGLTPGNASLTAVWAAPSGNGTAVSGYDVQYSSDNGSTWTSRAHTGTGTSATIPGLTNGTSYQVRVRAENTVGEGPWSAAATMAAGAPTAPTGLTLTAGHQKLAAAWTAPSATNGAAVTDYDVRYRADGTTAWTEWNAADTGTTTSATVTGLTNGTTYHVQARAANSRGDGPWSPSVSAVPAVQPPGAPTSPNLQKLTEVFVWFSWTAPADNGGAVITDYDVRYSSDSGASWAEWDPMNTSSGTSMNISRLPGGRSYVMQARAENSAGAGPWSASSGSVSQAARAPEKPDAPTLVPGGTSLTVNWDAPENNGAAITDYDVRHSLDELSWTEWNASNTSTLTTATITGLDANLTYTVQVRATNTHGDSAWSDKTSGEPGGPGPPTALGLTPGDAQLGVSWSATTINNTNVNGYDVEYRARGASDWSDHSHTGTTTSTTITTLTNGLEYDVRVRAKTSQLRGPWAMAKATPGRPAAPSAPTLTASSGQLTVSWSAPSTNGLAIADYDVEYSSDGGANWTEWNPTETSTATSATITGLTAGTYHARVRAASATVDGPWSASSAGLAVTTPPSAPDTPALASGDQSFSVSWTAPETNGAAITDYDVRYSSDNATTWTDLYVNGTSELTATATGLNNGTIYLAQVRAENSNGDGPWSDSASVKPGAPTVPLDIWVDPADSALDVSWDPPANDYGSMVTDYDVRYRTVGTSMWTEWQAGTTSTTYQKITGLTNGTKYQVQARAENANGPGAWSASITNDPGAPGRPIRPTVTGGDQQLSVWWHRAADHGSEITDYDLRYSSDGEATWTQWQPNTTSAETTATVTGLTNGTKYHVQVRAENARGVGPWSGSTFEELVIPYPPHSVAVTRDGTTLHVTWPRVWGGTEVTGYHVVYSDDDGYSWTRSHTNHPTLSASITGTDPTLTYHVSVAAVNSLGHSGWRRTRVAPSVVLPAAPATVTVTRGAGTLTATWPAVTDATGYNVVYSSDAKHSWTRAHTGATGTTATISGVNDTADYYVAVQAVNLAGQSNWTNSSLVAALTPLPAAPASVTVTRSTGTLSVTWSAVTGATGYNVVYSSDAKHSWTRAHTGATGTTATISGVNDTAEYYVAVQAVNTNGGGDWTNSSLVPVQSSG